MRKRLHPDYYTGLKPEPEHVRHCIGQIRQSLMCFGDVSINVYQWSPNHQSAFLRTDVPHTCRDFDKIQQWAKENWYEKYDGRKLEKFVEVDLPVRPGVS
jgi:hypothetical protein